ncbi:hypothetical protein A9Q79_02695 [Methylophaga sp. 42_25_T18]|nr:hypothetical protein A9Q79_02695 [Methylophaga sp. 42_25_T18]
MVQVSGDSDFQYQVQKPLIVNDVTGLNPIKVAQVIKPEATEQIINAITTSTGPISIGGGRYSMGGQVAYENSLHFDMRAFNKVIDFDEGNKEITVQSGMTWRDIQEFIDPYDLSIRIMQTYANFTVGGSLSVNVHGRYIGEGPLIESVLSLKVILANGEEVFANREQNSDIFNGVIGGYGGLGVITEVTLNLADNVKIERQTTLLKASDYAKHFAKNIRDNSEIVFHNGDLYPPSYDEVLDVSWYKTDKALTLDDRLIAKDDKYKWGPMAAELVGDYAIGKSIRKNIIDPLYYASDRVVWRNWEASYDVRELEPESRDEKTYVLREYFIPVEHFDSFVPKMKDIFIRNDADIINVSIRHAHASPENLLSWARNEVFAFVVYYQQGTDEAAKEKVKQWSVEMIDAVIEANGAYYLPYQIYASPEQFHAAYPRADEFFALKAKLDPENRFINQLWKQYYPSNNIELNAQKDEIKNYYRGEEQTVLTIPEWYLVFNPLEYAEFLEAGNNPSNFPFMASLDEYWTLYDRAVSVSESYNVDNSEYMSMLQVIGISTTVEYMFKGLYENTIGRFTRWTANNEDTEEDKIIAQAQRAYSDLIFDEAWYMFNFGEWIGRIWVDTDIFGKNFIRKLERKLFFTGEYGFKVIYAKLIGAASQATYEHGDGLIYLIATVPDAIKDELPENVGIVYEESGNTLISVPRWGAFTETVPKLVSQGVSISEISGNKKIAVSYITDTETKLEPTTSVTLFESKIVSSSDITRRVVMVDVSMLGELLTELVNGGSKLEHIYDY